eukprot:scaffold2140_cov394-Prasinococcus_capsulatus_cf.AAC.15
MLVGASVRSSCSVWWGCVLFHDAPQHTQHGHTLPHPQRHPTTTSQAHGQVEITTTYGVCNARWTVSLMVACVGEGGVYLLVLAVYVCLFMSTYLAFGERMPKHEGDYDPITLAFSTKTKSLSWLGNALVLFPGTSRAH